MALDHINVESAITTLCQRVFALSCPVPFMHLSMHPFMPSSMHILSSFHHVASYTLSQPAI